MQRWFRFISDVCHHYLRKDFINFSFITSIHFVNEFLRKCFIIFSLISLNLSFDRFCYEPARFRSWVLNQFATNHWKTLQQTPQNLFLLYQTLVHTCKKPKQQTLPIRYLQSSGILFLRDKVLQHFLVHEGRHEAYS